MNHDKSDPESYGLLTTVINSAHALLFMHHAGLPYLQQSISIMQVLLIIRLVETHKYSML